MGRLTPDVITTLRNLLKTGLMATDASMQLKCMTGFEIVGDLSSYGSMINVKP